MEGEVGLRLPPALLSPDIVGSRPDGTRSPGEGMGLR
jgi:hypothetical protein